LARVVWIIVLPAKNCNGVTEIFIGKESGIEQKEDATQYQEKEDRSPNARCDNAYEVTHSKGGSGVMLNQRWLEGQLCPSRHIIFDASIRQIVLRATNFLLDCDNEFTHSKGGSGLDSFFASSGSNANIEQGARNKE
jgi:hypothetical protein